MSKQPKRFAILACEVIFRELAGLAAGGKETLDLLFLPKGLHDRPEKMRETLQAEIDRLNKQENYAGILLGYALCGQGITGLSTSRAPLVIPRAHDCITFFLGSRRRYQEYFFRHPGTYFHTTGWLERGIPEGGVSSQAPVMPGNPGNTLEDYITRYGEDNGRYLWKELNPAKNYSRVAYVNLPFPWLPDRRNWSREIARKEGWAWTEIRGEPTFLEHLVNGPRLPADFLVVKPGRVVAASNDETIIKTAAGKIIDPGGQETGAVTDFNPLR